MWELGAKWTDFIGKTTGRQATLTNHWDKEELAEQLPSVKFIRQKK